MNIIRAVLIIAALYVWMHVCVRILLAIAG